MTDENQSIGFVDNFKAARQNRFWDIVKPWLKSQNNQVTPQTLKYLDITVFVADNYTSAEVKELLELRKQRLTDVQLEIATLKLRITPISDTHTPRQKKAADANKALNDEVQKLQESQASKAIAVSLLEYIHAK